MAFGKLPPPRTQRVPQFLGAGRHTGGRCFPGAGSFRRARVLPELDVFFATQQCGDLVTQRLAAARGHQHRAVAAGHGVGDDILLLAAETVVSEDTLEHVPGRRGHGVGL